MRELLAASRVSGVSGLFAAALVVLCSACKPDLPQTPTEKVVTAVFDPTTATIPLPNDLVFPPFNSDPNSVCPPGSTPPSGSTSACAQAELLASFNLAFPSDQEVAITIDFSQVDLHSNGVQSSGPPELDFASFTPTTFFVATVNATASGPTVTVVPTEPPTAADYARFPDHGTLTIHNKGHLPWAPGRYAVLLRGGADGVKTTDGTPVAASQIFALIAQGKDLTDPANLGLLRAQTGSLEAALAQGAQLNALINALYKPVAFVAADTKFPHEELAIASTFTINNATSVVVDAARGVVPLPIDLLRDPRNGKISALAACTFAGSKLAADGTCPSAAAGGFQALDGFATTGMILAQTSDLVLANTVKDGVFLYDISTPSAPVQVPVANLVYEPCELTVNATNGMSGCTAPTSPANVAPAIALQPAGATAGDTSSVFRSRPLKDATDYAVVITSAVHDKGNRPLGPGTVGSILRFKNPILVGGKSALQGVDDGTAAGLEKMRLQLQPVLAKLPTGVQNTLVMAYTFRTQTILSQALGLSALPYSPAVQPQVPLPVADSPTFFMAPIDAFHKWGVDTAVVPSSNIDEILEVDIETFNALDPITGAFMSDPTKALKEKIHVLIATPKVGPTPAVECLGGGGPKCSPMVVFRHGLGSGRGAMLTVADSFAAAGLTTVAIDAAKHGDRAFCTSGPASATNGCVGGDACMTLLPPGAQGDEHPPGACPRGFIKRPISPTCAQNPSPCPGPITDGTPLVSGNYLTSANLFRTRDTLRQDLIDESQLVRAIAFVPTAPGLTGHLVFDHMALHSGIVIDPGKIYYAGQSLGAIQGAVNVATNPRISKAVLNVGGGTISDIFTNSPAFTAGTDALLASLGIQRGTPAFLQFLVVSKTVLDPADPINFVGHLTNEQDMLPNLLSTTGPKPQLPKAILSQMANCDFVVPNAFGLLFASNLYADNDPQVPLPAAASFFAPGLRGPFQLFVGAGFDPRPTGTPFGTCPPPPTPAQPIPTPPAVGHGFLTDWAISGMTQNAQTDAAAFLASDTLPLVLQHQ
ncbi:MAG TPA: hypothetical protein VLM79_12520 [Kofleriaceae bacterium]|nr:hypothetical protein [Kofleriaceae bacterium]